MSYEQKEVNLRLEKYLLKSNQQFTLEDAAASTGMPIIESESAIRELMQRYDCKLKVTENGDLIYDFTGLHRRTEKSFGERLQEFADWFWKGFKIFYRIVTAVFLLIYFVLFVVILIALIIGLLSQGGNSDNDSKSGGAGKLFLVLFRVFLSIFEWSTILGYDYTYRSRDNYGYPYKHYVEKPGQLAKLRKNRKSSKEEKGFVASVYDFIFGPVRYQPDPYGNHKEVASFLKENKGLVSTAELQALAGWRRDEAENFMTELLGRYDGRAKISERTATLYGDFSQLNRSANRPDEAPIIYYWDEYEPEYELTGNKTGRNWAIVGMNSLNLVFSLFFLVQPNFFAELEIPIANGPFLAQVILGAVPFTYSLLFFLIPAFRYFRLLPLKRKQRQENARKRLMKVIFQHVQVPISLKMLTQVANDQAQTEEKLKEEQVEALMQEVIQDLGGESSLNSQNQLVYRFDRLKEEIEEMSRLRQEHRGDDSLGKIVFES